MEHAQNKGLKKNEVRENNTIRITPELITFITCI
jgi:hypothetical protein